MKPTDNVCPSHAIVYRLLATSASPTRDIFSKIFIKAWFCWGKMCLFCHMTSVSWLEILIQHTPSIICDFQFTVDFRLDILFPHIFWFLHQNWMGIDRFTLTKQFLASFNNHGKACTMLCGKGRVRTQDLGYQSGALWPLRYTPGSLLLSLDMLVTKSKPFHLAQIPVAQWLLHLFCRRAHSAL